MNYKAINKRGFSASFVVKLVENYFTFQIFLKKMYVTVSNNVVYMYHKTDLGNQTLEYWS